MKPGFFKSGCMEWMVQSASKEMVTVNFVNVILAYQIWVRRYYLPMPLERSIRKGLLEYY